MVESHLVFDTDDRQKVLQGADTLENRRQVEVVSGVPELDMFVRPPSDSCRSERNQNLCAVGVVVKQLQRVCRRRKDDY